MKKLFFLFVAVGIFLVISITINAQTSVNIMRLNSAIKEEKSTQLNDGNDINTGAVTSEAAAIENCSALQFKLSQLMNVEVEFITNLTLYNFIEEWWATRYHYGGNTKRGIDCSAFTSALLNSVFGLSVPRTASDQYDVCEKIKRDDLKEGDLVFFRIRRRHAVSHVGVYLGNGYFTHSSVAYGVTISSLNDAYYNKHFIGGGRVSPVNIQ